MIKRAARVGRKKPHGIPKRPAPRDAFAILKEVPGELGVELFMLARHVVLWAETGAGEAAVFPSKVARHVAERRTAALAEVLPRMEPYLRTLMSVTGRKVPEAASVQTACEVVATWAQEAGYRATALLFAEACAAIRPNDPYGAWVAARTNRILGEPWRAEAFYSRATHFAYREQAWRIYARAHLGHGRLLAALGRYRAAREHYRRAANAAYDQGEKWLAAQTDHDLLALTLEQSLFEAGGKEFNAGDLNVALKYGARALSRYPRHHERFPAAVHDFVFLLVCEHRYADAVPLLELLVHAPIPMHDKVIGWSTLARAVGCLGDGQRYGEAETEVLRLVEQHDWNAAAALINLAFGARALGDSQRADAYVVRAIELAEAKGHRLELYVGRELLRKIRESVPVTAPVPPQAADVANPIRELAARVAGQLASWRGPTWTKKERQSGLRTVGIV